MARILIPVISEYEERIKNVLNEVEKSSESGVGVILFIDELHLIMSGQGSEGMYMRRHPG
jgi:ATP-dependent Clp protease ATP-binding subunit ClpA